MKFINRFTVPEITKSNLSNMLSGYIICHFFIFPSAVYIHDSQTQLYRV